jgi:hypothetical protein
VQLAWTAGATPTNHEPQRLEAPTCNPRGNLATSSTLNHQPKTLDPEAPTRNRQGKVPTRLCACVQMLCASEACVHMLCRTCCSCSTCCRCGSGACVATLPPGASVSAGCSANAWLQPHAAHMRCQRRWSSAALAGACCPAGSPSAPEPGARYGVWRPLHGVLVTSGHGQRPAQLRHSLFEITLRPRNAPTAVSKRQRLALFPGLRAGMQAQIRGAKVNGEAVGRERGGERGEGRGERGEGRGGVRAERA